jgi:hypothetical protein
MMPESRYQLQLRCWLCLDYGEVEVSSINAKAEGEEKLKALGWEVFDEEEGGWVCPKHRHTFIVRPHKPSPYYQDRARERLRETWPDAAERMMLFWQVTGKLNELADMLERNAFAQANLDAKRGMFEYEKLRGEDA